MLQAIAQQLRSLANQLEGGGGMGAYLVGPGITVVQGVCYNLAEPIASDYTASVETQEFGRRSIVGEPSNAPAGMPRRSLGGYPLSYPGVRWDGYGTPAGPAQVLYNGVGFPDDAAIAAYKVASAQRDATLVRIGGTFSPGGPR